MSTFPKPKSRMARFALPGFVGILTALAASSPRVSGAGLAGSTAGTATGTAASTLPGTTGVGSIVPGTIGGASGSQALGAPVGGAPNNSIPSANSLAPANETGVVANGIGTSPTYSGANQAGIVGNQPFGTAGLPAPAPANANPTGVGNPGGITTSTTAGVPSSASAPPGGVQGGVNDVPFVQQ